MSGVVKFLFRIVIIAVLAFLGYAIFADLPPPEREVEVKLTGGSGG